jgi:hypothetical protein
LFDGKRTRLEAFPGLGLVSRPYAGGAWEEVCGDLQEALRLLAGCRVERQVDRDGDVSLYDHRHRVGKGYAERAV